MFAASARPNAPSATAPAACKAVERGELPSRKCSYASWVAAATALAAQAASRHSRTWLASADPASRPNTTPLTTYATAMRSIARIHGRPDMSTCVASGSGHQLLEELRGSWRTGDLEGNRPTVGLGRHGEPKKPTALPLRVNYPRKLGQESLHRREGPPNAVGHWNAPDRPGHQSGQELRAAGLKLRGREGAGDRDPEFRHDVELSCRRLTRRRKSKGRRCVCATGLAPSATLVHPQGRPPCRGGGTRTSEARAWKHSPPARCAPEPAERGQRRTQRPPARRRPRSHSRAPESWARCRTRPRRRLRNRADP